MANNKGHYSSKTISAIRSSITLGEKYQTQYPEIATMYQKMTIPEIIEKLDIRSDKKAGKRIAIAAVSYSLNGHNGGFGINAYEGLLPEQVLAKIREMRVRENLSKRPCVAVRLANTGVKPWTDRAAYFNFIDGKFIVSGTRPSEIEYASQLSQREDFLHKTGTKHGAPSMEKIAGELNRVYHSGERVRSIQAVRTQLCRYRKS